MVRDRKYLYKVFLENKQTKKQPTGVLSKSQKAKKKQRVQIFGVSGVYFLTRGNKIIYIGESSCIYGRISIHNKEGRINFDSFVIQKIDGLKERKKSEKYFINKHRPICNIEHNPDMRLNKI